MLQQNIQSVYYDTSDLPPNVLSLVDENFYDFIEQRLGMYQSLLLKVQQINSVSCFLLTDDPCQILNLSINDNELDRLKEQICFQLSDGTFFVKQGVKIGFKCLHDLLTKKVEEKLKQSKTQRIQTATIAPFNILSSPPSSLIRSVATTITTPTETVTSPTPNTHSSVQDTSSEIIVEHKRYLLNLLKQWCQIHKDQFQLDTFDLKEGRDFLKCNV